jgi:coenzyme PQQ precursor peptide PqqA
VEIGAKAPFQQLEYSPMKVWNKPQVREQAVGLEVTSYLPAEIDII